jgi:outer membrane protein TolC
MHNSALIHHQDVICCVTFGRFSLRRIVYTPQSAFLGALQLTPCWRPGIVKNPLLSLSSKNFDGGFLSASHKWRIFGLLVAIIAASIFAGCSKDFTQLRKQHAEDFTQSIAKKSSDIASLKANFDLDDCIRIALENNLDIKTADLNGRLAGIDKNIAFSRFLPSINVQFTHIENDKLQMRNAFGSYFALSDKDVTQTVISGQLSILDPETWFIYMAFREGEDIERLIAKRVRQAIRLQVTALYLACLSQESSVRAIESSLAQASALQREIEALYREGLVLKSDLEGSNVFLSAQQNNLSNYKRLLIQTKAELMEALGLSPLSDITLAGAPSFSVQQEELSEQIFTALINRPELEVSDRTVEVRKDALMIALAAFIPEISIFGDMTNNQDSYLLYENIWSYGISGILTIFDGFENILEYKAAVEEREKAMLEREQACLKIILEVIKARHLLDQAIEQRDLMSLESRAALTALRETEALWWEGLLTSSEKLDAINRNETAAANLSLAEYRYQVAAATMQDVMGLSGKE